MLPAPLWLQLKQHPRWTSVDGAGTDASPLASHCRQEGHDPLSDVLEELEGSQVRIRFGVDATNLQRALKVRSGLGSGFFHVFVSA